MKCPQLATQWCLPRISTLLRPVPVVGGASLMAQLVKNPPAIWKTLVQSLGWEDPLEKLKSTHFVCWPGEFHGLYSPWGHKQSDTTERLSLSVWVIRKTISLLPHLWHVGTSVDRHSDRIGDLGDFPGDPVAKISCSQFRGPGLDPWSGN